jgi:hypothetical protein
MPVELRETLHRAAAVPAEPVDLDRLLARGRRRRRTRQLTVTTGAFALVGAMVATGVLVAPDQAPPPVETPARLTGLPPGWSELPPPPEARWGAATAWTGEQLIVWGGAAQDYSGQLRADGFVFDGSGWSELAPGPLPARVRPATAWTGEELLVWGGTTSSGEPFGDGAAYAPGTGRWRSLPAAPIDARVPLSVWTGRELIVWGTTERRPGEFRDGAVYDPATDGWRPIADGPIDLTDATAVWTGTEMIVFGAELDGGNVSATETAIGAAYDPETDTWRLLPDSPLSPQASTASWTGTELIAWDYLLGAAAYDPARDAWRTLPAVPLAAAECWPASVPVDGAVFGEYCGQMVIYDTRGGSWRGVSGAASAGGGQDSAWFTAVPADPVVLLLGRDASGPVLRAYRYQR